jgi:hypothetical protein
MHDLVRVDRLALVAVVLMTACGAGPDSSSGPPQSPARLSGTIGPGTIGPGTASRSGMVSAGAAESSPSAPATAPTFQPIELRQMRLCPGDCAVTGSVRLDHPQWGAIWLLTIKTGGAEANDPSESYDTVLLAVDSDRQVRWKGKGGDWSVFQPAKPSTDKTGHAFIRYNTGRNDGLIILAPTPTGFKDFGSLPKDEELSGTRFDSSALVDRDRDGVLEIAQSFNRCVPSCGEGKYSTTYYRWNGSDYVRE